MRSFLLGLSISVAFIAGALFSQAVTGLAHAQGARRVKWEYYCVEKLRGGPETLMQDFAAGGLKGWELAAAGEYAPLAGASDAGRPLVWCFKRPI
jgi:hypothetical protein